MLIGGIALGLVLGLALGGRLENLAGVRLRFLPLLFAAVIIRFGTEAALAYGVAIADELRVPLLGLSYGLLLFTLWHNRGYPGLALAFIGIASNAIAILVNGGRMPVWLPAYEVSGLPGPLASVLHVPLAPGTGPEFFLHLGPISDVIPIPIWPLNNVASIGDLFLTAGLAFFLFATLLRTPAESQRAINEAKVGRYLGISGTAAPTVERASEGPGLADALRPGGSGTGLTPGLEDAAALERPLMMGSGSMGMASPAMATLPMEDDGRAAAMALGGAGGGAAGAIGAGAGAPSFPIPGEVVRRPRDIGVRVRNHPYIRLALNGSFSALWVGQFISLFGDRVNQIALAAFVYEVTKSPAALALTFLVGTIPNILFSPIAGTFVDRWDQKQVLVVSDILRAALVLLVPVAVLINVWLAYPLVFLITTVSLFFRPARIAVLPRIVRDHDLLAANSALWVGETLADVINYPIAGLFVVFLQSSLALAFYFDAASYLGSAALLATIVVPPLRRRASQPTRTGEGASDATEPGTSVVGDLKAGWAFLRHETVLLANTLQGTAGQFAIGIVTVASLVLAKQITPGGGDEYRGTYAFMETAIGVGNLVGGFALGLLATRAHKGMMIIVAYSVFGALIVLLGLVSAVPLVLGILFGVGVANMAFVIPSQTLFQERTPPELMGRVVSFRFALVFGGMTLAMGVGGLLIGAVGPGPVIAAAGVLSLAAGLAGFGVKALREA